MLGIQITNKNKGFRTARLFLCSTLRELIGHREQTFHGVSSCPLNSSDSRLPLQLFKRTHDINSFVADCFEKIECLLSSVEDTKESVALDGRFCMDLTAELDDVGWNRVVYISIDIKMIHLHIPYVCDAF